MHGLAEAWSGHDGHAEQTPEHPPNGFQEIPAAVRVGVGNRHSMSDAGGHRPGIGCCLCVASAEPWPPCSDGNARGWLSWRVSALDNAPIMTVKDCLFCRITRGDLDAHRVLEDDDTVVFLDHRPLFSGHCLVVPRAHTETLVDLPAKKVGPLFAVVQRISSAVETGLQADGFFVAVNNRVSQSVPHLHVHVIPRRKKDGLKGFFWPRYTYSGQEEMDRVRDAIVRALTSLDTPESSRHGAKP